MRRLVAAALLCLGACSVAGTAGTANETALSAAVASLGAPARILDSAQILNPAQEARLAERLAELERATRHQMAVVTVASLEGHSIEEFSIALARRWELGRRGHDDGLLVLVAPNERHVRIDVGRGLERALPDEICAEIVQQRMIPRFRDGELPGGIEAGVEALISRLTPRPI